MDGGAPGFCRELGLFDSVVVVAGGIVGVGIFANPSNVARVVADPAAILIAWAIGGAIALAGAFVWAELASRFPEVGGQYVYLRRAYPPVVGFLYGIALLFIINGGSLAAVAMLFASYVDRSFAPLGPAGIRAAAAAALIVLTLVNVAGVRAGKWTNNLLMAAKVGGMLTLVALAVHYGTQPATRFAIDRSALGSGGAIRTLLTALVPILFAYGGWQSCASIAAEIKDPARNLPRANVLGVIAVVGLYLLLNLAYLRVLTPAEIAASPALAADVARAAAGIGGARFVAALIVVSSLGFLAVVILTGPRLYYAMAADGLLWPAAGRLHPRYHTPVVALALQAAVSLVLLATSTYDQLLSYTVFADWLFFGLTAAGLLIVRRRDPSPGGEIAYVPGHPLTTGAFAVVAGCVVVNTFFVYTTQSLIGSAILLAAAAVFYVARRF
jgi:APA family basic amino acid/polyamine antiporter